MVVNDEIKDILSRRGKETVTSDDKNKKEKENLLSILNENKDNGILTEIVDGLRKKNPVWNFGFFIGYIFRTSETITCHDTEYYGSIIVFCKDGAEKMKLKIEYDIDGGRRAITSFDRIG